MTVDDYNILGGLTVDFENNRVTFSNGRETTILKSLSEVMSALNSNINKYETRNTYIERRLTQTEPIRTKIPDGYKISEPPTDKLRNEFIEEFKENGEYLDDLHKMKSKYDIGKDRFELKVDNAYNRYKQLTETYSTKYGSHDGSRTCEQLLDKLRDIETTFKVLGISLNSYKIK